MLWLPQQSLSTVSMKLSDSTKCVPRLHLFAKSRSKLCVDSCNLHLSFAWYHCTGVPHSSDTIAHFTAQRAGSKVINMLKNVIGGQPSAVNAGTPSSDAGPHNHAHLVDNQKRGQAHCQVGSGLWAIHWAEHRQAQKGPFDLPCKCL